MQTGTLPICSPVHPLYQTYDHPFLRQMGSMTLPLVRPPLIVLLRLRSPAHPRAVCRGRNREQPPPQRRPGVLAEHHQPGLPAEAAKGATNVFYVVHCIPVGICCATSKLNILTTPGGSLGTILTTPNSFTTKLSPPD